MLCLALIARDPGSTLKHLKILWESTVELELIVYVTLISCLTYAMWNAYSCRLWQTLSHFISCKHTRDIYLSAYFHLSSVNHRGNSLYPYLHFLYSFSIKWVHFFKLPLFIPSVLACMRCLLISAGIAFSRYLATASSDHTVKIWNVDGFTLEKTLTGIHEISTFCCTYYVCLHVKNWPNRCFWANMVIWFCYPCAYQDIKDGSGTVSSP